MKKLLIFFALSVVLSSFGSEILPFRSGPLDFPSSFPGIIYSNASRAMYREKKSDLSQYQVLGKVKATTDMKNVLLLVNWGDTSLAALKEAALAQYPEADDIVNVEIDVRSYNILVVYIEQTVTLRGVAVKYKR